MKILITGASGFLGRQILPRLISMGHSPMAVGRSRSKLEKLFPEIPNCSYEEIEEKAKSFDVVLHLATLNNNSPASRSEFDKVNVEFCQTIVRYAKNAGIPKFINVSSFHVLRGAKSNYAQSKKAAVDMLSEEKDIQTFNLYLPAVYGDDFSGKLAFLRFFPNFARKPTLTFLSSFVPTVHVDQVARLFETDLSSMPSTILLANPQDRNPVFVFGKRLIDIGFSVAVIIFAFWIFIVFWLWIRLDSKGPGLFVQDRIGRHGQNFRCYKFRTMKEGTRQAGTHEVTAESVTSIGAFLRRTKIDELPQVWNILRGDMSLVGPRPGLPVQTELTKARLRLGVFEVLPGITGWAQINDVDMSDPERLAQLDASYIAQRGLLLECRIILATFLGWGQGDKIAK